MALQLKSQIFYRLGKMESCIDSYEKLKKFGSNSDDLQANMIGALVAGGRSGEVDASMRALRASSSDNFEIVYNAACALIENKKYADAEELLLNAQRYGSFWYLTGYY
jgi:signal recognition particle subunit SRP72